MSSKPLKFAITAAWVGEKEIALLQLEAGLRAPAASLILSYDPRFEKIVGKLAPK